MSLSAITFGISYNYKFYVCIVMFVCSSDCSVSVAVVVSRFLFYESCFLNEI